MRQKIYIFRIFLECSKRIPPFQDGEEVGLDKRMDGMEDDFDLLSCTGRKFPVMFNLSDRTEATSRSK